MNLLLFAVFGFALSTAASSTDSAFRQYPATETLHGQMMLPLIADAQERKFRTVLRQAISKGYGVVEGGTQHERLGPNFGGHYVLVQWGCGTACMEGALIDTDTGHVLRLPQIPGTDQKGFEIPTIDSQSPQFRTDSRLLVIPSIGDSYTYYYVLDKSQWHFLKKLPLPEQR